MQNLKYLIVVCVLFIACKTEKVETANTIIDKAIEVAGGEKYVDAEIVFDFRDKQYKAIRKNDMYQYEREFKDATQVIRDVLNNKGFKRFINTEEIVVADTMSVKYAASVNSVHYFALLPYGLKDNAVIKEDIGGVSVKGKNYHKIKVTFQQEGGGEDFEDVFLYWINTETYTVDYLAYSYQEASGVGIRFREAYNVRTINGLRFVDYNNFKPKEESLNLLDTDKAFEANNLKLLSKIELKNITVK
ncbi:MAG: deoxyribose-phosphate aldolase [Oceanihabitans sp.]|nr:deoxyribose-phosphate aldolase [Oceanihabitans sp.]